MGGILNTVCCPKCGGMLEKDGKSLKCVSGHVYDVAKEGYVNLLPPGKGKNARSGDDAYLVDCRRKFLSTGKYAPISDRVSSLALRFADVSEEIKIIDLGCGEGYHTIRTVKNLETGGKAVIGLGIDASKHASAAASKASVREGLLGKGGFSSDENPSVCCAFAAGNIFSVPCPDETFDIAVSMFAPVPFDECARILKKGGILIIAGSGKDHLAEMRDVVFDEVLFKDSSAPEDGRFDLLCADSLKYKINLQGQEEISSLFGMTPFYYRVSLKGKERLGRLTEMDLTADVSFSVLSKK